MAKLKDKSKEENALFFNAALMLLKEEIQAVNGVTNITTYQIMSAVKIVIELYDIIYGTDKEE